MRGRTVKISLRLFKKQFMHKWIHLSLLHSPRFAGVFDIPFSTELTRIFVCTHLSYLRTSVTNLTLMLPNLYNDYKYKLK